MRRQQTRAHRNENTRAKSYDYCVALLPFLFFSREVEVVVFPPPLSSENLILVVAAKRERFLISAISARRAERRTERERESALPNCVFPAVSGVYRHLQELQLRDRKNLREHLRHPYDPDKG